MQLFRTALAAIGMTFMVSACMQTATSYRDQKVPLATNGAVDLDRYAGLWYQIARFPNSAEKGCVGVTAEYLPQPSGELKVISTCRDSLRRGAAFATSQGLATPDSPDNARLRISYMPGVPFTESDYWILDVTPDYEIAVIGSPGGKLGWVLARDPSISESDLNRSYEVLRRNGYDPRFMTLTPQRI